MPVNCPKDKVIRIKTGSHAGFRMIYTNPTDPAKALSLQDVQIHITFVNPRTRIVLFDAYIGHGILVMNEECGYFIVDPGDTRKWPLGRMPLDVKYTKGGAVQHSSTFYLDIECGHSQSESVFDEITDALPISEPDIPPEVINPEDPTDPDCIPIDIGCAVGASVVFQENLIEENP